MFGCGRLWCVYVKLLQTFLRATPIALDVRPATFRHVRMSLKAPPKANPMARERLIDEQARQGQVCVASQAVRSALPSCNHSDRNATEYLHTDARKSRICGLSKVLGICIEARQSAAAGQASEARNFANHVPDPRFGLSFLTIALGGSALKMYKNSISERGLKTAPTCNTCPWATMKGDLPNQVFTTWLSLRSAVL